MRFWLAQARLTAILSNPVPGASDYEKQSHVDYGNKPKRVRGTLMGMEVDNDVDRITLCKPTRQGSVVHLQHLGIYRAVLNFVQEHHSEYGLQDWNTALYEDADVPLLRQS
jgi:hypothetical protein